MKSLIPVFIACFCELSTSLAIFRVCTSATIFKTYTIVSGGAIGEPILRTVTYIYTNLLLTLTSCYVLYFTYHSTYSLHRCNARKWGFINWWVDSHFLLYVLYFYVWCKLTIPSTDGMQESGGASTGELTLTTDAMQESGASIPGPSSQKDWPSIIITWLVCSIFNLFLLPIIMYCVDCSMKCVFNIYLWSVMYCIV